MSDNNVSSNKELITPAIAKDWVDNCNFENNRILSHQIVDKYVHEMLTKTWKPWSTLTFSDTGKLIDGQHRLKAVSRSGLPQWFIVIRGVDMSTIDVLDTGKPRNVANIAKIKGMEINNFHIACFNAMCLAPGASYRLLLNLAPIKKLNMIEDLKESIFFACEEVGRVKGTLFIRHSVMDAVVARAYYCGEDKERLRLFRDIFRTGYGSNGSPDESAQALRNELLKTRPAQSGKAKTIFYSKPELYLLSQLALKHFLSENGIRSLRLPKNPVNMWKVPLIDEFKKHKGAL